jgi:integrase/recombinase XerD
VKSRALTNGHAWDTALEGFTTHMRSRNFSERTVETYLSNVRDFSTYCQSKNILRPSEVSRDLVHDYQHALFQRGAKTRDESKNNGHHLSASTQANYLHAIRCLFRYLAASGVVLYDPTSTITLPRTPQLLPRVILSKGEIARILAQPNTKTALGYRDRAIMELMYACGLRVSELSALDLADVDLSRGLVTIRRGKGQKSRVVPMGEVAAEWMEGYLRAIRSKFTRDRNEQALFLSWRGKRIPRNSVLARVAHYTRAAKIKKRVGCHTFRHTCATHMLRGGADIRSIQELLGHATLASTEVYTRVEIGDLVKVHKKFHPREKL